MNASGTQRIVVLGHEGHARDQLVTALSDLGAVPVWVGTPAQSDPAALSTLNPNRLVISLDPTIELELEPYGELLGQPGITVLFDDAETTRGLSGWDLNRWARHLAAKLLGRSVLPAEHPPSAAADADAPAEEALTLSVEVESFPDAMAPSAPPVAPAALEQAAPAPAWQDDGHYDSLAFDPGELEAALQQLDRNPSSGYSADEVKAANFEKLEPLSEQEQSAFRLDVEDSAPSATDAPAVAEPDFIPMPPPDNFDPPVMSVRGVPDEGPVEPTDDDLKRLIAEAEGLENRLIPDDLPLASDAPAFDTRAAASEIRPDVVPDAPKPRVFDLSQFSLVEDGAPMPTAEPPSPAPAAAVAPSFSTGFGLAEQGAAEDSVDNEGRLYLAISGIGGPGAVRSLVEAQGGDIAVGDAPGGGARFAVRLPLFAGLQGAQ